MASVAEKLVLKFKLKTELSEVKSAVKNIAADCERRFAENHPPSVEDNEEESLDCCVFGTGVESFQPNTLSGLQRSLNSGMYQTQEGKKRKGSEMKIKLKIAKSCCEENEFLEKSERRPVSAGASTVACLESSGAERGDSLQMNASKMRQCTNLLKILMNHPVGWVFNQPVDPVKLNIPDYFSIISRPMDLGTIKKKLGSNQYLSTAEFAADVKLTFANAMRYNPPGNDVHVMAKELNNVYNSRWRLLEVKWRNASTNTLAQSSVNEKQRKLTEKKHTETKACAKQSEHNLHKGGIGLQSGFASKKAKFSSGTKSMNSNINSRLHDINRVSSSELDSKRSSDRDYQFHHSAAYKQDSMEASAGMQDAHPSLQTNGLDLDLDCNHVAQSNFDHSTPTRNAIEEEADLPCAEQLSPSKALRAAMLKSRFADTILKAQHRSLGEKVDPVKLQQEKKKLEKRQFEEKARLEAQVRAKEEAEARKQRDMEREAARAELLKMEKAAAVNFNYLANIGCPPPGHFDMTDDLVANFMKEFDLKYGLESPLEKLGLFIKKEESDDEFDNWCSPTLSGGDMEEGEMHCS